MSTNSYTYRGITVKKERTPMGVAHVFVIDRTRFTIFGNKRNAVRAIDLQLRRRAS